MTEFTVNSQPFDPHINMKFRIKWDGQYIAGVSKMSPLKRSTEVIEFHEGGDPSTNHKSPGRTSFEAIVLERGLTHDSAFEEWVNKVWQLGASSGQGVSPNDFRKDIVIEIYNEAGQLMKAYKVFRCWPSEYQALPTLDVNGAAVAIEVLKLENEGWERT